MPTRHKTAYPGVFYREVKSRSRKGKTEKVYYAYFSKNGKKHEEKVGREWEDNITPQKASSYLSQRLEGKIKSPKEKKQEEAAAKEAARLAKENRWTIERLWNEYRNNLKRGGKAGKTDISRWELYLKKPFASKEPSELVKLDTDRLRINLLKTKSPQTVKHILALLRRIINFGVDQGVTAPLPFKLTLPPVDNIKTEDLTPEQMQSLLTALDNTNLVICATMMKLALFTGMRRGEIFKLQWNDLDFHREFIHIQEPKGGKSQKIPMNANAKELLKNIPSNDSDYLFPASNGGPRKDIAKDARKIKKDAKLPTDFRPFHGLRHVYATMLASSGKVDMYTLQKLLTHKSPEMTQRYAHLRDDALKQASNLAGDIVSDLAAGNNKVVDLKK